MIDRRTNQSDDTVRLFEMDDDINFELFFNETDEMFVEKWDKDGGEEDASVKNKEKEDHKEIFSKTVNNEEHGENISEDMTNENYSNLSFDEFLDDDIHFENLNEYIEHNDDEQIEGLNEHEEMTGDFTEEIENENLQNTSNSRFMIFTEEQKNTFKEELKNKNTKKKTLCNMKILNEYFKTITENRKIEDIPPTELSLILENFFLSVRKSDGSEYEPTSLRGMLGSFNRYLQDLKYSESLITSASFSGMRETLKMKFKHLKTAGKGNFPNAADTLLDDDIDLFYKMDLLGLTSPHSLLRTLHRNNMMFFGLRANREHQSLCWGDVVLKKSSSGRYLEYRTERLTKTRPGENPRNRRQINPKAFETGDDRCPVAAYEFYEKLRPENYKASNDPFYIQVKHFTPKEGQDWFKRQPLGINSISKFVPSMATAAKMSGRKLTNTSYRKHLASKLNEKMVPKDIGRHVTGHKNAASLDNYDPLSLHQQRRLSHIVSGKSIQSWQQSQEHNTVTEVNEVATVTNADQSLEFTFSQTHSSSNGSNAPYPPIALMPSSNFTNCSINVHVHNHH